jgi:A/G-specific adenine glycosylase
MAYTVQKQYRCDTPSTEWRRSVRRKLLAWYRKNARDLPWRRTRDPYAIWISEIMLQQTQVATVERYFGKFMATFPSVVVLANAPEDAVLRLWEGLGYYRRARQLHAAAKKIVQQFDGRFPDTMQSLRELPGVGRYTAGAIASIAFDIPAPILEANTVRLLCRLIGFRSDPKSSAGQTLLWQTAENLLPRRSSGEFNQALMELGSLVCTPRNPQCLSCPLIALCPTQRGGWQHRIPALRPKPAVENVQAAAVVIVRRGTVLLRKCGPQERWAGLWDFPRFELKTEKRTIPSLAASRQASAQRATTTAIISRTKRLTGISISTPQHLITLRHTVTRFRITLDCFTAKCDGPAPTNNGHGELRWVKPSDLEDYPLSTTGRKLARLWREMKRC